MSVEIPSEFRLDSDRDLWLNVLMTETHTRIAEVVGRQPSPVEHIVGEVVVLRLECGHEGYGNTTMDFRPGNRWTCRKPHEEC